MSTVEEDFKIIQQSIKSSKDPAFLQTIIETIDNQNKNKQIEPLSLAETALKLQKLEENLNRILEVLPLLNDQLDRIDMLTARALELWIKKMET